MTFDALSVPQRRLNKKLQAIFWFPRA